MKPTPAIVTPSSALGYRVSVLDVRWAIGALCGLLTGCSLLAPERDEFERSRPDGGDDAGACPAEPGDPGPGQVIFNATDANALAALSVDDEFLFISEGRLVTRLSKNGDFRGYRSVTGTTGRLHAAGGVVLFVGSAGTYQVTTSAFDNTPIAPSSAGGAPFDIAAAGTRVFATYPADGKVVEIGGAAVSAASEDAPRDVVGDSEMVFWATRTNVRRYLLAGVAAPKTVLDAAAVAGASAINVALDGGSLAVGVERAGACGMVHVLPTRTTPPIAPARSVSVGLRGPIAARDGRAFVSTGDAVVEIELATGKKRTLATRLPGCAVGVAADATSVFVGCPDHRIFKIAR